MKYQFSKALENSFKQSEDEGSLEGSESEDDQEIEDTVNQSPRPSRLRHMSS